MHEEKSTQYACNVSLTNRVALSLDPMMLDSVWMNEQRIVPEVSSFVTAEKKLNSLFVWGRLHSKFSHRPTRHWAWARSWSRCTGSQPTGDFKPSTRRYRLSIYFPPGLRLPSQLKSVIAHRPVPNYTACWQRHMGVNNLLKVVTRQCGGRGSNSQPPTESPVLCLSQYETIESQR